jgi:hypothetical protein
MAKATKKAAPKKTAPAKKTPTKAATKTATKTATKAAPKKAAPKKSGPLKAYSIGQRKNVPMNNARIVRKGNRFVAQGEDKKGNRITAFLGREGAEAAVKAGHAKKQGRW